MILCSRVVVKGLLDLIVAKEAQLTSVRSFWAVRCSQAKQAILEKLQIQSLVLTEYLVLIHELPAVAKSGHTNRQLLSWGSLGGRKYWCSSF